MIGRFVVAAVLLAAAGRAWSLVHSTPVVGGPEPQVVRALCSANDFCPAEILASPLASKLGLESVDSIGVRVVEANNRLSRMCLAFLAFGMIE